MIRPDLSGVWQDTVSTNSPRQLQQQQQQYQQHQRTTKSVLNHLPLLIISKNLQQDLYKPTADFQDQRTLKTYRQQNPRVKT